jgi:hypothetical protein
MQGNKLGESFEMAFSSSCFCGKRLICPRYRAFSEQQSNLFGIRGLLEFSILSNHPKTGTNNA